MNESLSFEYEMGDARESLARGFARLLGAEAGAAVAHGETRVAIAREGGKMIVIEVEDLPPRRLGSIVLPAARVRVTLSGYTPAEAETFKADFHRTFQRGGG